MDCGLNSKFSGVSFTKLPDRSGKIDSEPHDCRWNLRRSDQTRFAHLKKYTPSVKKSVESKGKKRDTRQSKEQVKSLKRLEVGMGKKTRLESSKTRIPSAFIPGDHLEARGLHQRIDLLDNQTDASMRNFKP